MVMRKLWSKAVEQGGGVIQRINNTRIKNWKICQSARRYGISPMVTVGVTAGLAIWLANQALRSKRHVQGEY